ncbi:16S rRNA (guanine(527)-N(7))-methyltransferase RsmG [Alphaproteobacteria bacterium]|nr:16S rRNA (guanine(527)-N(7))-methyltransferase RsmG [Alphaproteobacteria bacterium]
MLDNKSLENFIFNISSSEEGRMILEKIQIYKEMLIDENSRINLISKRTLDDINNRHLLDSVQLMPIINSKQMSLLDVGTGAGLPGIMLAIAGCKNVNLVEKQGKKCEFLKKVNNKLELKMNILNSRVEDIAGQNFNFIIARAFAKIDQIISLTKKISNKNTKYILLKGKTFLDEIQLINISKFNIKYFDSITSAESKIIELSYK